MEKKIIRNADIALLRDVFFIMQDIRAREGVDRAVCDYIAGMTDNYAVAKYSEAFIPLAWSVK